MSRSLTTYLSAALLAAGTFGVQRGAAQDAPLLLSSLTITSVKPEAWSEFLDLQAQLTEASKKAGIAYRHTYSAAVLGDLNLFIAVGPVANFAQFDAPSGVIKAMGEREYERWLARARRCSDSISRKVVATIPELSIAAGLTAVPDYVLLTTVKVLPGKTYSYQEMLKNDVLPAWKKAGVKAVFVQRTILAGDPNEFSIVLFVDKFAMFDQGSPTRRGMEEDAYRRYTEKQAGMVASVNYQMYRYERKLSYEKP